MEFKFNIYYYCCPVKLLQNRNWTISILYFYDSYKCHTKSF